MHGSRLAPSLKKIGWVEVRARNIGNGEADLCPLQRNRITYSFVKNIAGYSFYEYSAFLSVVYFANRN